MDWECSKAERQPAKRLARVQEFLMNLGTDPEENINHLVQLGGELLEAACALYSRLDGEMLCPVGQWHTPKDYSPVSRPEGHICYDVILNNWPQPLVVRHLPESPYAHTDPNVALYSLQTYIGQAVKFGEAAIGSLCVVYRHDVAPGREDLQLMRALASAVGIEENRRMAMKELRKSKERYQLLVETMDEGLALADANYEFIFVNQKLCQMLGYRPEELLGHHFAEFVDDHYLSVLQDQIARRRKGEAKKYEVAWKGKSGRTIHTLISPKGFYDDRGGFIGSLGVLTDISERKRMEKALKKAHDDLERRVEKRTAQLVLANEKLRKEIQERLNAEAALKESEARYRLLAENVSDVIWTTNLDLEITYVSPSLKLLLGLSPEEAKRRGLKKLLWPASLELAKQTLAEEMALESLSSVDRSRSRTLELELIHREGCVVWAEVRTTFLRDSQGRPVGLLGVSRGIGARKQVEKELARHRQHLEKLVEERTAELIETNRQLREEIEERQRIEAALKKSSEKIKLFAYSVSHDLKNPVVGISGLARLLRTRYLDNLDNPGKELFDKILSATDEISNLVEKINIFISTKEVPLKIRRIQPKEVFQTVRDEFSSQLSRRQINWSEPEDLPKIKADRLSLLRAVRNLVDNALKYGGDELTEINLGCEIADGFTVFSVMDNGIGLTLEDHEKIFGAFQRSEASRDVEGSGLGLAIVKEIAEQHGGKVWVNSGPERGTTFYFSIAN
jgi:PAS domain S-box-containing protein